MSNAKLKKVKWLELMAIFFSLVAIVISGYSLMIGQRQLQGESSLQVLEGAFQDWFNLAVASQGRWEVRHLDEVPETY